MIRVAESGTDYQRSMSLIQHWLRDKAAPYSSADRVYTDIDAALSRFVALRPKLDVYSQYLMFRRLSHPRR